MGITETGKALADIKGNIVSILQGGVSFDTTVMPIVLPRLPLARQRS